VICNGTWIDLIPGRCTPSGLIRPIHCKPSPPASAYEQASELSADDVLEHLAIERKVSHQLLQLRVLILKLLQPSHLRRRHSLVLFPPVEVGRLANPCLPADLLNGYPIGTLLQDERLLASENLLAFMVFRSSPTKGK
jgi:hypothetical protein